MICRSCDKPTIMVAETENYWQCPRCGAIIWSPPKIANYQETPEIKLLGKEIKLCN